MTKRHFFTKCKAAIAAALVTTTLIDSAPASAGPAAAAVLAAGTAKVCGPATVATGPFGLLCFASGGLLSVIAVFAPSP